MADLFMGFVVDSSARGRGLGTRLLFPSPRAAGKNPPGGRACISGEMGYKWSCECHGEGEGDAEWENVAGK